MKYINRITLLIAVVFATTLQAQTKTFNSQVRVKQVPLSSSLDSLVTINSSGLLTYLPKSELVTEAQTLSFSNGQLTISDANTIDLDTYYYSQTDVDGLISSSAGALEFITEGGNTGIAIKGRNPDNYGDIGDNAVDLSFSNSASTTRGAVGSNSLTSGANNTAGLNSLVSGSSNIADVNSISGGLSNVALRYSLVSGRSNTVGNAAFGAGREIFAPSYAETALGMFGTDYVPVNVDDYNSNDRLFSLANGINDTSRSEALIVYKSGNATLNGDLTVGNIVGNGSQLIDVIRTVNTSTLQTSATLNSAFPFADNPDGTIVVNKDTTQPYIYIRSNSTTWRQVTTNDVSGIVPNSDNWDNIRVTGNYTSSFNVTVGTPVNAGSMAMTHIQTSSDSASQQAVRVTSSETWIRTLFQGTWSAWMKLTMI